MADTIGNPTSIVPPPTAGGGTQVIDLGNGYSLVIHNDGITPPFQQIVSNRAVGGGTAAGSALAGHQIAAQTAADQLAEQQRQFNENLWYQKARGDQQQQLAEGNALGYFRGSPTLARDQLNENARQYDTTSALDYYKRLQDIASNPRNYALNFFLNRGQQAPASVLGMGNTPVGLSAMQPLSSFLPSFLQTIHGGAGTPGTVGQQGAPRPTTTTAAPATTGYDAPTSVGYTPVDAAANDAAHVSVSKPGSTPSGVLNVATPNFGNTNLNIYRPTDTPPAPTFDPTTVPGYDAAQRDYALNTVGKYVPGQKYFARGGVVPEPVIGIGLHSGQQYMFGENGPEGVIPADLLPDFLKKRGGMTGKPMAKVGDTEGNPVAGPFPPHPSDGDMMKNMMAGPFPPHPTDEQLMGINPIAGPFPPHPSDADLMPMILRNTTRMYALGGVIGSDASADPIKTNEGDAPAPNPGGGDIFAGPLTSILPSQTTNFASPGGAPGLIRPTVQQAPITQAPAPFIGGFPTQGLGLVPGGAQPVAQPVAQPIAQPVAQPMAPAGITSNPTPLPTGPVSADRSIGNPFLPYGNAAGVDTNPFTALGDATPPFLQRIYGQQADNAAYGTNTTQRFALPQGVPLVSSLAFSQMSPSEQQALISLISASGIDPADYFAQVGLMDPRGAPQSARIAYQGT